MNVVTDFCRQSNAQHRRTSFLPSVQEVSSQNLARTTVYPDKFRRSLISLQITYLLLHPTKALAITIPSALLP